MEQEQKLKEHHTVEAPGGQKVHISKEKRCLYETRYMLMCIYIYIYILLWEMLIIVFINFFFGAVNCTLESMP